jgi:hypothetical protein
MISPSFQRRVEKVDFYGFFGKLVCATENEKKEERLR